MDGYVRDCRSGGWGRAGRIIFKRKGVHDLASLSPPHLSSGPPAYKMVHLLFFFVADCWGRGLRTALRAVSWGRWGGRDALYAPDGLVEDALQVALCERRALEVLLRLDLLGDHDGLLVLDGRHLLLTERLLGALVIAEIELCADEDNGYTGRVVVNLRVPLHAVSHGIAAVRRGDSPLPLRCRTTEG